MLLRAMSRHSSGIPATPALTALGHPSTLLVQPDIPRRHLLVHLHRRFTLLQQTTSLVRITDHEWRVDDRVAQRPQVIEEPLVPAGVEHGARRGRAGGAVVFAVTPVKWRTARQLKISGKFHQIVGFVTF
jgi:hypothetical protein